MDVLSDVLSSVRLSGSVLFTAEFTAPFGVDTPASDQYAGMLVPRARKLILFHLIIEGVCIARSGNTLPVRAEAGDMLLLPYGDAFALADSEQAAPCSIFELVPPLPWASPPHIESGGGGPPMRLLCGFLHADELLLQPLLADLPGLLVIRARQAMPRLRVLQDYLLEEIQSGAAGSSSMVRRLVELLFVEALRHALTAELDGPSLPLRSLGDPVVGRALALLHAEPARDWTVESLAHEAAASRSLLAERFARMLGCPPMEYLTRWRMQIAARRMLEGSEPLKDIALAVGYQSDNGFNRTFRRYFAEPPARWRRRHREKADVHTG